MKQFVEVGQRVRHLSPNGVRSRCATWPEGVWLEHGIEGTVIEYYPALPRRVIGDEVFERIPPYAVVKFDNGANTCIDSGNKTRWERINNGQA